MIINDRKFDIRLWTIITSISPLIVFIYDEFYLRLAVNPFTLDNNDIFTHLTN